ncbi:P-loop containing nucleoside triphosphate hydrolase protein [Absidia repens]|uniref:Kinesin-like protein n=1 Tax=Absidia repens TaxID=90262 RepID=A0A1X2IVU4_9FUNG|nr:P-loop containing nucleoside triphosphate hydrolase protein [Absidia repens]
MTKSEKIKIVCRIRPFLNHEVEEEAVRVTDKNTITLHNKRDPTRPFTYKSFSSCYSPDTTQETIFTQDVLPVIERVFDGYSSSVFTYGVTGSGKSYSMQGVKHDPGIIPRVMGFLFETKQATQVSSIDITMSYMEILKETVFDMLTPKHKDIALDIREDSKRNVFVANLKEERIETYNDFSKLFNVANKNRSTASTKLNSRSSRSHAILTLNVKTVTPLEYKDGQQQEEVVMGRINLIDLAGSEDNRKSGNGKARMTESAAINKSLFVLAQVVQALNSGATRIPFRDSKLTRILQSTLEGTALGMMIINIAPGHNFINDTANTLNFASRSKEIKSAPKVNIRRRKTISQKLLHGNRDPVQQSQTITKVPAAISSKPNLFISSALNRKVAAHDKSTRRLTVSDRQLSNTHLDNNNNNNNNNNSNNKRPFGTYEQMLRATKRPRHSLQPSSTPNYSSFTPSTTASYHVSNRRSSINTSSIHNLRRWLQEVPLHDNANIKNTLTTGKGFHPQPPHPHTTTISHRHQGSTENEEEELVIMTKADYDHLCDRMMNQAREEWILSRNGLT